MCLTKVLNPVNGEGTFFRTDHSKPKKMTVLRKKKIIIAYYTQTYFLQSKSS